LTSRPQDLSIISIRLELQRMTEATTPITIDPPENQGGGNAPSIANEQEEEAAAEAPRPSRDYSIPSDPPDNQGGGW
jgi:hypothetical protein